MNKEKRNLFLAVHGASIEKIIAFVINNSKQYKNLAGAYLSYKDHGNRAYSNIANINLNYEDIKQQLLLELIEALEEKDFVNMSYIKKICVSRLKNILRRYHLEMTKNAQGVVFENLDIECFMSSPEVYFPDIVVREMIHDTLQLLDDPLEKKYLKVLVGNLGIAGYEGYSFLNANKAESDDLCIAKLLGFDSYTQSKYIKIKKTVKTTLFSVVKSYDDVA